MTTTDARAAAFAFASGNDWARAAQEAQRAVAADPEDASAQALLALSLAQQTGGHDAVEAGRRAVALDPELAFAQYAMGLALYRHGDLAPAETAAREALRLDADAAGYELLGMVLERKRRWKEALAAAEEGLRLEPDHIGCSNVRAAALSVLGRNEEATQVSLSALAAEPENAFGHTEHGWLMLRQARYDEALVSFRQALRLSPTYERARLGIIEALKARNGIYRLFLRYTLWMNSFEGRTQWFILLGLAFGSRIIRTVSRESPALAPVLLPLLALYTLFAIGTWLAAPLSNLLLRINPFGRLILSKPEVTSSNLVAACLATALAGGLLYLATSHVGWAAVGGTAALMVMPISGAFSLHGSRGWRVASIVAAILALLGAATIVLAFIGSEAAVVPVAAMLVGVLLNQWVLNYFAIKYQ